MNCRIDQATGQVKAAKESEKPARETRSIKSCEWDSEPSPQRKPSPSCPSPVLDARSKPLPRDDSDETNEEENCSASRAPLHSASPRRRAPDRTPEEKPLTRNAALSEAPALAPAKPALPVKKKSMTWNSDEEGETKPSDGQALAAKKKKPKLVKNGPKKEEKRPEAPAARKWEDDEPVLDKQAQIEKANSLLTKLIARKKIRSFEAYIDRDSLLKDCVAHALNRELHRQISQISDRIIAQTERLALSRKLIKQRLEVVVNKTSNGLFELREYGSLATGLLTPFSDMDLAIDCKGAFCVNGVFDRASSLEFLQMLAENLQLFGFVREARAILSATVPVVKIEADASVPFEDLPCAEPAPPIKVDLIIQANESFDNTHTSTRTTKYLLEAKASVPSLLRNIILLKYALNCADLMNSYKGGLNSYGLCLLYIACLKSNRSEAATCLGSTLWQFLEFVAADFDAPTQAINLNGYSKSNQKCISSKSLYNLAAPLVVLDPTHYLFVNVTSSCQMYASVKELMAAVRNRLVQLKAEAFARFRPRLESLEELSIPASLEKEVEAFLAEAGAPHARPLLEALLELRPVDSVHS